MKTGMFKKFFGFIKDLLTKKAFRSMFDNRRDTVISVMRIAITAVTSTIMFLINPFKFSDSDSYAIGLVNMIIGIGWIFH